MTPGYCLIALQAENKFVKMSVQTKIELCKKTKHYEQMKYQADVI